MPVPLIVDVVNAHRAALLAQEQAAMQEMARRWLQVEQALDNAIQLAALELINNGTMTPSQIMRSRRWFSLMEQTRDELRRYEAYMEPRIVSGQRNAITQAVQHSEAAVQAAASEAQIVVPFNRLPVTAVENMVGLAGDGSPLRAILQDASRAGADALGEQLVRGIALGVNPREVARRAMRLGLGTSYTRMVALARTEQLRVYRLASLDSYRNSRVVVAYKRLSARDRRTCIACLFADGQQYPVEYGFDAHPQCLVGGTVVSSPTILATSKRWFDGQVIEIRTVNGNVLTVTENHPILTDKGWVAANLLQEGDNVISSLDSERTVTLVDPNDYSRPTVIEDVIEAFARTGGMIPVSVPTSPVDFHGDGMHGNVDIVRADSLLESWRQSVFGQPGGEQSFVSVGFGLGAFSSYGAIAQLFPGARSATRCDVHGFGYAPNFFGGALTNHKPIGFGLAADRYAGLYQATANSGPGSIVGVGKNVFRFAAEIPADDFGNGQFDTVAFPGYSPVSQVAKQGSVADAVTLPDGSDIIPGNVIADRIVNIARRQFSGHVYNLQTSTGWYIAGGIITHNCRCTLIPVLANVPAVQFQDGKAWFRSQPETVQRAMLGPSRFDAWSSGRLSLDDMIQRTYDPEWGGAITPKSVQALGIPRTAPVRTPRPRVSGAATSPAPRGRLPAARVAAIPQEAKALQQSWVHGSNSRDGVLLKEAVRSEFGVKNRLVMNPRGHNIAANEVATTRPVVRGIYERTQAYFKAQGITEVKLYRGVKSETNVHGVIESWTTDLRTARKFNGHTVMEETVSVERILMAHVGPGWKNGRYGQQYEFVVMP